jgi:hypothetical protein
MAAGSTYSSIATTTLGSNQSSVTFNSISGYTDLRLIIAAQLSTAGSPIVRLNGDSGTNYSTTQMMGNGSSASSTRLSNFSSCVVPGINASYAINTDFNILVDFMNYANSSTYKTVLSRANKPDMQVEATVSLWRNTAAVTSIEATVSSSGVLEVRLYLHPLRNTGGIMANTYTLIASSTVGAGGASSIDFTSIPSTYTDLVLMNSGRNTTNGNETVQLYFNNDTTATNYNIRRIYGNGSAASSASFNASYSMYFPLNNYTASTFSSSQCYIPNYAGSTNKSFSIESTEENNATLSEMVLLAGLWSNTAAINRITLVPYSGTFAQYSTAYLYGIKSS